MAARWTVRSAHARKETLEAEMDVSKLRGGELIAAIGGVVLLVALLFLNWYGVGGSVETGFGEIEVGGEFGAWDGQGFFGTLANLVILAAGVFAVGLAILTATSRTVALPIAASALTTALGIGGVVMVVLRMLLQPGDGEFVDLEFGIYLALIGAVAVAYGGWQSMKEEGTTFQEARDRLQSRTGDEGGPVPPAAAAPEEEVEGSTGPPAPPPPVEDVSVTAAPAEDVAVAPAPAEEDVPARPGATDEIAAAPPPADYPEETRVQGDAPAPSAPAGDEVAATERSEDVSAAPGEAEPVPPVEPEPDAEPARPAPSTEERVEDEDEDARRPGA